MKRTNFSNSLSNGNTLGLMKKMRQANNKNASADVSESTGNNNVLADTIATLNLSMRKIEAENVNLKKEIAHHSNAIQNNTRIIETHKMEMEKALQEVNSLKEEKRNLELELKEYKENTHQNFNKTKTELEAVLQNKISEIKTKIDSCELGLAQKIQEHEETLTQLNSDNETITLKVEQIQETLETVTDLGTHNESLIAQFQEEITALSKTNLSLSKQTEFIYEQTLNNTLMQLTTQGAVAEISEALDQFKDDNDEEEETIDPYSTVMTYAYLEQELENINEYGFNGSKHRVEELMAEKKSLIDTTTFDIIYSQLQGSPGLEMESIGNDSGDESSILSE